MILKAKSPYDDQWYFFVDKCLPFGAAISCSHFQEVSDAVAYLVQFRSGKIVINYLDDYLFAHFRHALCNQQVQIFIEVCTKIGLPISEEKTFWADTIMTFLGFLIDTVNQIIGIPMEKLAKGQNMINHILKLGSMKSSKRKITVKQLEQLCGFLNFLSRAIVPSQSFTRRLYAPLCNKKLRPHHHLRVTEEMLLDLEVMEPVFETSVSLQSWVQRL